MPSIPSPPYNSLIYFSDSLSENLLFYQRPLREDGQLRYEFFYQPGVIEAHPVLDRLVLLLKPEGVRLHEITDAAYERRELHPDNEKFEPKNQRMTGRLPFRENDWNQLELILKGDVIDVRLNQQLIFQRALEPLAQRKFGLFHYADQTAARVRKITWSGDWPDSLQPALDLQYAGSDVYEIEQAAAKLPMHFECDFSKDGLSSNGLQASALWSLSGTNNVTVDGIASACTANGNWTEANLRIMARISGDFDLQATVDRFEHAGNGHAGLHLIGKTDDVSQSQVLIARVFSRADSQSLKGQFSRLVPSGERTVLDSYSACEANSGTLRLIRLGDKVHYLFAEDDSSNFRLVHTDTMGSADIPKGGLTLGMFAIEQATSKAVWKKLSVRADKLSEEATKTPPVDVIELDQQREKLPVTSVADFAQESPDPNAFYQWPRPMEWSLKDQGYKIPAPGFDTWESAGVGTRQRIEGDFDIDAEFEATRLAVPREGDYSTVMLQVELATPERTQISTMLIRRPSGDFEISAHMREKFLNADDKYSDFGRVPVSSASSLRISRRGNRYLYLARPDDASQYSCIAVIEKPAASVNIVRLLLHTGGAGRDSEMLLKKISIHAERYELAKPVE